MKSRPVKLSSHRNRRPSRRRGATIVEFAFVAPVFFTLLFAAIEFASLSTIRNTCNNAAYEGARKLVIPGAVADTGKTEAERIMGIVGVDTLTVTVTPSVIDDTTTSVTVRVEVPYADNAMFVPIFTGNVTLTAEVTLKTERYDGFPGP
ncbi:MAG: TadE/TadG family type IV pilus assembly protein [Planctomycetaceae bacterium]